MLASLNHQQLHLAVTDLTHAGEARRLAAALAQELGFGETERGRLALVVTEAATNLVRHGGGGELFLIAKESNGGAHGAAPGGPAAVGIEVLALDAGRGMADIQACLRDGYSTAGTPGTGLGAVQRLSTTLEIDSAPGRGTALLATVWSKPVARRATTGATPDAALLPPTVGLLNVPYPGETVSGDGAAVALTASGATAMVIDGLGHGLQANEVARAARLTFDRHAALPTQALVQRLHEELRGTRGGAVGVAVLDTARAEVRFCGIGNIACVIVGDGGETKSLVSMSGIVGYDARRFQEFTHPFPRGGLLILCSDGIGTQWRPSAYPGFTARSATLAAGLIYRDFTRRRDDATVLLLKPPPHGGVDAWSR
jgi:anti-sigma regulatory factor (Ser/Thr protein kinase)